MANLIGRFETQNKRLSISASSPSRSSSVVSHITGDSVKEEIKEKREWPPKSVVSTEKPPIIIPTSNRHVPPSLSSQPKSDPAPSTASTPVTSQVKNKDPASPSQVELEVPLTVKALQRQTAEAPGSFLENWRKDIPLVSASMASETDPTSLELTLEALTPSLATPTAVSMQKFGNPISPRTPTAALKTKTSSTASKATPAAPKAPIKGLTKSPAPKQSLSFSTTQPLRAQHTGQSVASTTSTRKPTSKLTPVTPSQSKTGPRSDASRAKTPTSVRPKTPSTGLFAPTAASLARSRNAPLQLPTPTKKPTLSSSSMDRLSKPTAASLSKARSSAVAASTSTSRPTVAKPKAATKSKETIAQKPAAQTVAAPDQNGSAAIPAAIPAAMMDNIIEAEAKGVLSEDADPTLVSSSPAAPEEPVVGETRDEDSSSAVSASVANQLGEPKPTDELEDMVNLLESAPLAKPETAIIPDIPDDILEIPDETETK